jgi:uncharacterized protein YbaR (Trm112 family)
VRLEPFLLEVLACPACRSSLRVDDAAGELVCTGCGLAYPVRDDIPVMLVDEARPTGTGAGAPTGTGSGPG